MKRLLLIVAIVALALTLSLPAFAEVNVHDRPFDNGVKVYNTPLSTSGSIVWVSSGILTPGAYETVKRAYFFDPQLGAFADVTDIKSGQTYAYNCQTSSNDDSKESWLDAIFYDGSLFEQVSTSGDTKNYTIVFKAKRDLIQGKSEIFCRVFGDAPDKDKEYTVVLRSQFDGKEIAENLDVKVYDFLALIWMALISK